MNEDLLIAVIKQIEISAPELKGKIFPGAADINTVAPYVAFKAKESPIRSKDGIVGYVSTFDISVFDKTLLDVKSIKDKIVDALEGFVFDVWSPSYESSEDNYYPDYDVHGITLTFKI